MLDNHMRGKGTQSCLTIPVSVMRLSGMVFHQLGLLPVEMVEGYNFDVLFSVQMDTRPIWKIWIGDGDLFNTLCLFGGIGAPGGPVHFLLFLSVDRVSVRTLIPR